jgi:hypothetical protein
MNIMGAGDCVAARTGGPQETRPPITDGNGSYVYVALRTTY